MSFRTGTLCVMDHVQTRVDDWVKKKPDNPGEGSVVSVNMIVFWPSTATEEEIKGAISLACENTWAAVQRKLTNAA